MPNYSAESIRAQLPSSTIAATPEPLETTNNGTARGHALYDSPAPGTGAQDLPPKRPRTASKRAQGGYLQERARSRQRSDRYIRTLERSRSKSVPSRRQSQSGGQTPKLANNGSEVAGGGRAPSKSPTPIPISTEEEAQPRSSRAELAEMLQAQFRNSMADHSTQELADVLETLRRDQEDAVQSEESDTEVRVLPSTSVRVGGGFHLNHSTHNASFNRSNPVTYSSKHRQMLSNSAANDRFWARTSGENASENHINSSNDTSAHALPKSAPLIPSDPILDLDSPLVDKDHPYLGYPLPSNPIRLSSEFENTIDENTPTVPAVESQSQPSALLHRQSLARTPSSQSLGDPIQRSPAPQEPNRDTVPHSQRPLRDNPESQSVPISTRQFAHIQTGGTTANAEASRPSVTLSNSARGTTITRTGPAGSSSYRTRLNIVSISSQRGPSQTNEGGPVRRIRQQTRNAVQSTPRRSPVAQVVRRSHSPLELLDEDEDDIEATTVKGPRAATRSRKPTSRDLHGNEYLLWLKVRDVLWAFAIQEGNFKARSVYNIWFDTIYHQVFLKELPGRDYRSPSETARKVTVNSMATCRGHEKERIRDIVKPFFNFVDPTNDVEQEANKKKYHTLWPNSFHCSNPEADTGHYESEVIRQAITAAFFHSPTAVGVKHPEFFEKMEDTIVAYILAMIQSCIGEWEHGYLQKTKLNSDYLNSLYICHYAGLEEAAVLARSRLNSARASWFEKSMATVRVKTTEQTYIQPITRREDVRPDTPNVTPPTRSASSHPSGHRLSPSRTSRRFSPFQSPPLAANILRSPHPQPGPSTPRVSPAPRPFTPGALRTPLSGQQPPSMSPGPEPTPERDGEGRYTMRAKGKGPIED